MPPNLVPPENGTGGNDSTVVMTQNATGHLTSPNSANPSNHPSEDDEITTIEEQERLSADLALFLSNPSLRSALSDGSLDLASYSSTIESELETLESECIAIYRSKADEIVNLREEIDACDAALASLQEMLLGFQADLGGLSGDIRTLQGQSQTLGVQLTNRRNAEHGLRAFLERVVIPPAMADVICTGAVDPTFVDCVKELNEKYGYICSNVPVDDVNLELSGGIPPRSTAAGKEMKVHMSKLRLQAVAIPLTKLCQIPIAMHDQVAENNLDPTISAVVNNARRWPTFLDERGNAREIGIQFG